MEQGECRHNKEDVIVYSYQPFQATRTMDGMCDLAVGHGQDGELHDGLVHPHHAAVLLVDGR